MESDDDLKRMITRAMSARPDQTKEITDIMNQMPQGVDEETVVNRLYKRAMPGGAMMLVLDQYFVDRDYYQVSQTLKDSRGAITSRCRVRCQTDIEALEHVVRYLNQYQLKKIDG